MSEATDCSRYGWMDEWQPSKSKEDEMTFISMMVVIFFVLFHEALLILDSEDSREQFQDVQVVGV